MTLDDDFLEKLRATRLTAVFERIEDGCTVEVILAFDSMALGVRCEDDDSLTVASYPAFSRDVALDRDVSDQIPWTTKTGKDLGLVWAATNSQGYEDAVVLSFGDWEPTVLLVGRASDVVTYVVDECSRPPSAP